MTDVRVAECCSSCSNSVNTPGHSLYCAKDSIIPRYITEEFNKEPYDEEKWDKALDEWMLWSKSRSVKPFNVCDSYVLKMNLNNNGR